MLEGAAWTPLFRSFITKVCMYWTPRFPSPIGGSLCDSYTDHRGNGLSLSQHPTRYHLALHICSIVEYIQMTSHAPIINPARSGDSSDGSSTSVQSSIRSLDNWDDGNNPASPSTPYADYQLPSHDSPEKPCSLPNDSHQTATIDHTRSRSASAWSGSESKGASQTQANRP